MISLHCHGKMKIIPLMLAALVSLLNACAYTAPFRRIDHSRDRGLDPNRKVIVTLSAVEHQPGKRKPFFDDTKRVLDDLPNHSGLIGYSFRFQFFGPKAWTMTAWEDEASRDDFAESPIHRTAVRNSRQTAQNMRFLSVEIPAASLPMGWPQALRLLESASAYDDHSARAGGSSAPRASHQIAEP